MLFGYFYSSLFIGGAELTYTNVMADPNLVLLTAVAASLEALPEVLPDVTLELLTAVAASLEALPEVNSSNDQISANLGGEDLAPSNTPDGGSNPPNTRTPNQ